MGAKSRRKGASLERELVQLFRKHGWAYARRALGQARPRQDGLPHRDLEQAEPFCVQAKGGAAPSPWRALAEAVAAAGPGDVPLACLRRDKGEWVAVLRLEDLLSLMTKLGACVECLLE